MTANGATRFIDRLMQAHRTTGSWLMIGLDPVLSQLPDGISRDARGVAEFNREIIEATKDLAIGYKPNAAFYEVMGPAGWEVLAETRAMIPRDKIALLDAKRGDIGDTSEMYARSIFDSLGFDATTVSPYTGLEGLQPFLDRKDRGTFVLCRTSNRDNWFQDSDMAGGFPLYEEVAAQATRWSENVGLVIGGTDLAVLGRIRQLCPSTPFLVPGVGAQGARALDAVEAGSDANGNLAIITVARSVLYSSQGQDFAAAARAKALELVAEMSEIGRE